MRGVGAERLIWKSSFCYLISGGILALTRKEGEEGKGRRGGGQPYVPPTAACFFNLIFIQNQLETGDQLCLNMISAISLLLAPVHWCIRQSFMENRSLRAHPPGSSLISSFIEEAEATVAMFFNIITLSCDRPISAQIDSFSVFWGPLAFLFFGKALPRAPE